MSEHVDFELKAGKKGKEASALISVKYPFLTGPGRLIVKRMSS